MSGIAIFPLPSGAYSERAFTADRHEAKVRDRVVGNRFLMDRSVFRSIAQVFTDVDL
jgi:hypothetical protein